MQENALSMWVATGWKEWKTVTNSRSGTGSPGLRMIIVPNSPLNTGSGSIGPWSW